MLHSTVIENAKTRRPSAFPRVVSHAAHFLFPGSFWEAIAFIIRDMLKITVADDTDAERNGRWANWIRLIGKGDIEALGALYDESSPVLFGLVLRILEDRQLAEEALFNVYTHVREQAARFDPRDQPALEWLIAITRRLAMEQVDRSSIPLQLNFPERDPFREKRRLANLALEQLPEEQRCVLEMIYMGGLNVIEAADLLQRSREYVARQIVFGMKTLRTFSEDLGGSTVRICSSFGLDHRRADQRVG
jgi:RNA polymerase sigma-70 factor (ECF subfamily)